MAETLIGLTFLRLAGVCAIGGWLINKVNWPLAWYYMRGGK